MRPVVLALVPELELVPLIDGETVVSLFSPWQTVFRSAALLGAIGASTYWRIPTL